MLQNLFAQSTYRRKQGWARPNSGREAASKPEREKTASQVEAPEISERLAPRAGARCPRRGGGGGTCHSTAQRPRSTPAPAPAGSREPQAPPGRLGLRSTWVSLRRPRDQSRASGPRPFPRSGPPAHSAQRLRTAGPIASGRVPNCRDWGARSSAAKPPPPPQGPRSGPPRGGPPSAYSPGLPGRRHGPPLPPPPAAAAPRLLGRPHWALGLRWVKCRGAGAGSLRAGVARRTRERARSTNGPRGGGPGGPRRGARLRAAVRGGENAAAS